MTRIARWGHELNTNSYLMESTNQTDDRYVLSNTNRFYILMEPLYGTVDTQSPVESAEYQTLDDLRRVIAHRVARVQAILESADSTGTKDNE